MNSVVQKIKNRLLVFKLLYKKSPEAFGEIYDAYVGPIYRFIYFKVLRVEIAEDLTSETFLRMWQYIQQKETGDEEQPIVHFQAFLYKVARNVVADFYRKKHTEIDIEQADLHVPSGEAHASWHQAIEHHEEIARLLPHLKDVYREVIVLRYIEGYSLAEIGNIMGKSPGNIRVIVHRSLAVLREMASKEQQGNSFIQYDDTERTYQTPQCAT